MKRAEANAQRATRNSELFRAEPWKRAAFLLDTLQDLMFPIFPARRFLQTISSGCPNEFFSADYFVADHRVGFVSIDSVVEM
jgi:hypothetical protein